MVARNQAKDKLAYALFDLMRDTTYSRISVSALCTKASVERSTFYRNFESKSDVVELRILIIMNEYLASFLVGKTYTFRDYMLALFKTFERNEAVFKTLFENNLGDLLLDSIQHSFDLISNVNEASNEERYHLSFHVGGIYNFVKQWVQRGMQDTPEQLTEYATSLFPADFKPIRLRLMASGNKKTSS